MLNAIIEPLGVGETNSGYSNRSDLNQAEFVLCQNQDLYEDYVNSPSVDAQNRYIHIINSADAAASRRLIMVSPDDSGLIIKKAKTDKIYATNGDSVATDAAGANVLFTKISNPTSFNTNSGLRL